MQVRSRMNSGVTEDTVMSDSPHRRCSLWRNTSIAGPFYEPALRVESGNAVR